MSVEAKKQMLALLKKELSNASGEKKDKLLKKIEFLKKSLSADIEEEKKRLAEEEKKRLAEEEKKRLAEENTNKRRASIKEKLRKN